MNRRGIQDESDLLAKWPLDALMVLNLSFSFADEAVSTDPARYEALINGQLHRELQSVSGRDVSILTRGGVGCLAQESIAPVALLDTSSQVDNSTPLLLLWFFTKSDHAPAMKADSLLNGVPLGLQSSQLVLD